MIKNYVVHIRSLKQTLHHGINDFEKDFFKLMNNFAFRKTKENIREHRDIKLVTTDNKRSKLASGPNYHTIKYFLEKLLAIEMKKIKVKMNKPVYLGLSILEINKTLMYEFWYDYIKPKENAKLCDMDTDSFAIHIKTKDVFMKALHMMLKKDLIHQIMKSTDH